MSLYVSAWGASIAVVLILVFVASHEAVVARQTPGTVMGRKPLMGWNTWCTQNSCGTDWCTSAEVLDVAQTIKDEGFQEFGYDHINLDDCWGTRDPTTHKIEGDPTRFPEGMKAFIAKVHALGFKFGLYTDIGQEACHHPFVGSYGYYAQDAETFADWEVDYVKFDGCDQPPNTSAQNLTCEMRHNDACSECGNSYRVYNDHHDQWESTSSVINFLATQRQMFWGADPDKGWPDPDFVFTGGQGCGAHSGPGVRCPGQTNDEYITEYSIWAIAGGQIIFATDPRNITAFMKSTLQNQEVIDVFQDTSGFEDVVMVPSTTASPTVPTVMGGKPADCTVSLVEQASHAQCTVGASFGCYDNKTMWTNQGCRGTFDCDGVTVDCNVDGAGLHQCPCTPPPPVPGQAWLRPLQDADCAAVVLFNPNDFAHDASVNFADVPQRSWSSTTTVDVRDLWAGKDLGSFTGRYTASSLPVHGSVFLKLCTST